MNTDTHLNDAESSGPGNGGRPLRTVVFVDYQNMYNEARRTYGWEDRPGHFGNIKPIALGRILTQDRDHELKQVRVYTGVPSAAKDKRGYAIMQRRLAAWVAAHPRCVEVFPRSLRYPPREGREKGVDVELAIDLVRLAMDDEYDVAVLASGDTDLQPPLEFIIDRYPEKFVETAAFDPEPGFEANASEPLDVSQGVHHRHKIPKKTFEKAIADRQNFVTASTKPDSLVEPSRWEKISRRLTASR